MSIQLGLNRLENLLQKTRRIRDQLQDPVMARGGHAMKAAAEIQISLATETIAELERAIADIKLGNVPTVELISL